MIFRNIKNEMKKYLILSIAILAVIFYSCSKGESQDTSLYAKEFSAKLKETPGAQVLDVRTSAEYSKGHIQNAVNIDWNGSNFAGGIEFLDRTKPVFVYCLSGSRSSAAANKMRSAGFKEVYELKGGILKWREAELPLTTLTSGNINNGMTIQQYDELLGSDKLVLVDFYADWCAPCREIKPYLEEISKEMSDNVLVVRINVDENPGLSSSMKIDAIPELRIYRNKELKWSNTGYIKKEEIVKNLKVY